MAGPLVSIPLSVPIEHNGRPVTALTLRQPRPNELPRLRRSNPKDPDFVLAVIANLTGLPRSVVNEIDMLDLVALKNRLSRFTASAR